MFLTTFLSLQFLLSDINLFLIETTDTAQNTVEYMVVTMVPDKDYVEYKGNAKYTFINKGAFSGVILYSNLDGSFRNIYVYGGNFCPIIPADQKRRISIDMVICLL